MTTTETRSIHAGFTDTLSGMDTMTDEELSNAVWERFWRERALTLREQLRDIATRADSMTEVELSHAIRAAYDSQRTTWSTFRLGGCLTAP